MVAADIEEVMGSALLHVTCLHRGGEGGGLWGWSGLLIVIPATEVKVQQLCTRCGHFHYCRSPYLTHSCSIFRYSIITITCGLYYTEQQVNYLECSCPPPLWKGSILLL